MNSDSCLNENNVTLFFSQSFQQTAFWYPDSPFICILMAATVSLCLKAARTEGRILASPEPACLVKGFGDNETPDHLTGLHHLVQHRFILVLRSRHLPLPFASQESNTLGAFCL